MSHGIVEALPAAVLAPALPGFVRSSPWRCHRLFPADDLVAVLAADIARLRATPGVITRAWLADGACRALCLVTPLAWDSTHFGLPMGRLDAWLEPALDADDVAALLADALAAARAGGLQHLCAHVDSDDYALFNPLVQQDFRLVDSKRTYIARRHRPARSLFAVRDLREEDRAAVEALAATAHFPSRFSRDTRLDAARTAELYRLWMRRLLDTPPAQRALYVVARDGEVVACGGVREIDFTYAGLDRRILGDGVFVASPRGTGAYPAVIDALIADGIRRYPLLETKVSESNLAAIRVLERLGYQSAGSQHALHWHA